MWDFISDITMGEFVVGTAIGLTLVAIAYYYDII